MTRANWFRNGSLFAGTLHKYYTYFGAAWSECPRNCKQNSFLVGKQVSNVHFVVGTSFKQRQWWQLVSNLKTNKIHTPKCDISASLYTWEKLSKKEYVENKQYNIVPQIFIICSRWPSCISFMCPARSYCTLPRESHMGEIFCSTWEGLTFHNFFGMNVVEKIMIPYSEGFFGEPQGVQLEIWFPLCLTKAIWKCPYKC